LFPDTEELAIEDEDDEEPKAIDHPRWNDLPEVGYLWYGKLAA
jgi:hypothetical protein